MHLNFGFTAVQILWTLTFAALLVLLVVLLGRDRSKRFPWFTTGIMLVAMRLLITRLLSGRLPMIPLNAIFIALADLGAVVGLMVVVELARRAFGPVSRRTWIIGTVVLLAIGMGVLAMWGPWPARKMLTIDSPLAVLRLMQLIAQKGDLLVNLLEVQLGVLVVLFGRRFKAGWRSHTQQIAIGLSTAAMGQLLVQRIWQYITVTAHPTTEQEYERVIGLGGKLLNGNSVVYLAVLVWWIVCLWINEPAAAEVPAAAPHAEYLVAETAPEAAKQPADKELPPVE